MKAAFAHPCAPPGGEAALRTWLAYVIETAIDMLDALDAAAEDLEDDETEDDREAAA